MIWFVVFAMGVVIGLLVGNWWALLAAVGFGAYIGVESEVDEVPPAFLGLIFAVFGAAGIAVGLLLRRRFSR